MPFPTHIKVVSSRKNSKHENFIRDLQQYWQSQRLMPKAYFQEVPDIFVSFLAKNSGMTHGVCAIKI